MFIIHFFSICVISKCLRKVEHRQNHILKWLIDPIIVFKRHQGQIMDDVFIFIDHQMHLIGIRSYILVITLT